MRARLVLNNMLWLGIVVRADNRSVLCIMRNRQGCGMQIKKAWDRFWTKMCFSACEKRIN